MIVKEILVNAKQRLRENGIDEREARLLLAYALNVKSEELVKYEEIDEPSYEIFKDALEKRCNHIPFQYIVGHQEFMKLDFKVNENVLIPRSDTEILVEEAIKLYKDKEVHILDMCTGSGCIAISLAKYLDGAIVTGVDISKEALSIAKENALLNQVKVDFIESNLFESINDKFDVIVSNPPYIKKDVIANVDKEVKEHEPILALDGGEDGLAFYKKIIEEAKNHLKENGYLLFEIGFDQANDVKEILENNDYRKIRIIKDYSGNDRVVVACL